MLTSSIQVALRIDAFDSLVPEHLFSALDDDSASHANDGFLLGTTEWSAPWRERQLSFGLDFGYDPRRQYLAARWSTLRTNVVVHEPGVAHTLNDLRWCVARMFTRAQWELTVLAWLHKGRMR